MTEAEYKKKYREIEVESNQRLKALMDEYAFANNPYKEGDLFTDHIGTIKIKKIGVYYTKERPPSCYYDGDNLNKNGTLNKREPSRIAYQSNLVTNQ